MLRYFRLGLLFALCAAVLVPSAVGLARPGGGQNYRAPTRVTPSRPSYTPRSYSTPTPSRSYSSPSYSTRPSSSTYVYVGSRSAGSRSSGSGWSVFWFFVGLIIVVVILVMIARALKNRRPERATLTVNRHDQAEGLAALKAQDPAFNPQAFVDRARSVVAKVNEAWLAGNMGPARRVISDGVYVRFQTQLALLKSDGLRNVMADWKVASAEIMAAEADPSWDTVHVKIVGEARDLDVPLSASQAEVDKKLRSQQLTQYHEVWSFVRRRGKQSKQGVPALEGKCPSCGADLPLGEVVKCEYCQALVNSGEHDWVLAEITQPEEWRPGAALGELPGLEELRTRDASISRQQLEDRASVIFWKWIEARSTGKVTKLARFCMTPPQNEAEAADLSLGVLKLRQVAVGSAELAAIGTTGDVDRAIVQILWSASVDGRESEAMMHHFVLARSVGAKSKGGLSSLDCPNCGGQLAASDAVTCSYCGTALTGGKHEWSLVTVESGEIPPAYEEGDEDDHG